MVTLIIIVMVLIALVAYLTELIWDTKGTAILSMFLLYEVGVITTAIKAESKPQAINVYRGETTLEITYRDNVPIDSVVVFKNE